MNREEESKAAIKREEEREVRRQKRKAREEKARAERSRAKTEERVH